MLGLDPPLLYVVLGIAAYVLFSIAVCILVLLTGDPPPSPPPPRVPTPRPRPRRRRTRSLAEKRRLWAWSHVWQRGRCALCPEPIPAEYDGRTCNLDHDDPFSLDGPDTSDNLQATHAACNRRKGARRVRSRRERLAAAP